MSVLYIFGVALDVLGVAIAVAEWNNGFIRSIGLLAIVLGMTLTEAAKARGRKRLRGSAHASEPPSVFEARRSHLARLLGIWALVATAMLGVAMAYVSPASRLGTWLVYAFFTSGSICIFILSYFGVCLLAKMASRL